MQSTRQCEKVMPTKRVLVKLWMGRRSLSCSLVGEVLGVWIHQPHKKRIVRFSCPSFTESGPISDGPLKLTYNTYSTFTMSYHFESG
jgi:hypothetical protein